MAAWCDHQEPAILPKPKASPQSDERLLGCWDFFTVEALVELLADVSYELGKRGKNLRVMAG